MIRRFHAVTWLCAWVAVPVAGCSEWTLFPRGGGSAHETGSRPAGELPRPGQPASRPRPGDTLHVVHLVFDVLRVELPIETIRHSRKIWNHVDELRIDSALTARLARNGLRVGAASADSWPAIQAVLAAASARVGSDQFAAKGGLPLAIKLGAIRDSESVFSYDRDTRLVGKTFSAGDKLVSLDYVFRPELGGCTDIETSFEIRHDRGVMTWERQGGLIRQMPAYDRHVFTPLTVLLTLRTGEFLVIGPSEEATNEYLVGSRFLTGERASQPYEVLLCITPRPYQTKDPQRPPR